MTPNHRGWSTLIERYGPPVLTQHCRDRARQRRICLDDVREVLRDRPSVRAARYRGEAACYVSASRLTVVVVLAYREGKPELLAVTTYREGEYL